jgi:hypothetical protein
VLTIARNDDGHAGPLERRVKRGLRGIPDDLELGCATDGGKNLVHAAQDFVLDQVLGAVAALKHRQTL